MSGRAAGHLIARGCRVLPENPLSVFLRHSGYVSRMQVMPKSTKTGNIGQTAVNLQDGLDMQELPTMVRNTRDVGMVSLCNVTSIDSHDFDFPKADHSEDQENLAVLEDIVQGIGRCGSLRDVFSILVTIPEEEKTPKVALHALKKIIALDDKESNKCPTASGVEVSFSRTATLNELVDTICDSVDPVLVSDALKAVSKESKQEEVCVYRDRLCDETLTRVTDGKYNIMEVCEIVKLFYSFKNVRKIAADIDKLWVGLVEKEEEITEDNIDELFQILPMLNSSQNMLLNILEKKIINGWWRLTGPSIASALSILFEVKMSSQKIFANFSRWMSTNVHTLSEDDVLGIVRGFCVMEYTDQGIESALERYVKVKGVRIKNPDVLAAIMDFCAQFRFRSQHILEASGEYFILHGNSLSSNNFKSLFVPFGLLDFPPPNGLKFWKMLETVLTTKFIQFRAEDALDLMLTCVYLERHPINFIRKVFNPYFLDRLQSTYDQNALQHLRTKLKLFDTAMTLECPIYKGPLLPKDHSAKSLWQDGRIKRMVNSILEPLARIVGGQENISTSVVLSQLPTMGVYVIDILLHPRNTSMMQFNLKREPNVYVALLIHIPEHYCSDGKYLMGPQVMRRRHFRRLGLKVAELDYSQLAKLKVHLPALESYLSRQIRLAEKAIT